MNASLSLMCSVNICTTPAFRVLTIQSSDSMTSTHFILQVTGLSLRKAELSLLDH